MADFTLQAKLGADISAFVTAMKKSGEEAEKLAEKMKKTGEKMSLFITAPLTALGADSLKIYGEHIKAVTDMGAAFAAQGETHVQALTDKFSDFADKMQDTTNVSRDTILQMEAQAAAMGINKNNMEGTITTAMGLSKVYGIDMKTALTDVVKAQNGNYTMLQRFIPQLKNAGSAAEKYAILTQKAAVGNKVLAAETEAGTGPLVKLKNTFDDLLENIGADIMSAINPFIQKLQQMLEWFKKLSSGAREAIEIVLAVMAAVGPAIMLIVGAMKAWAAIQTIVNVLLTMNPIGLIITAIGALILIITALALKYKVVRDSLSAVWSVMKGVFNFIKDELVGGFKMLYDSVVGVIDVFKGKFSDAADSFKKVGSDFKSTVVNMAGDAVDMANGVAGAFENTASHFSGMLGNMADALETKMNKMKGTFAAAAATTAAAAEKHTKKGHGGKAKESADQKDYQKFMAAQLKESKTAWDNLNTSISNGNSILATDVKNASTLTTTLKGTTTSMEIMSSAQVRMTRMIEMANQKLAAQKEVFKMVGAAAMQAAEQGATAIGGMVAKIAQHQKVNPAAQMMKILSGFAKQVGGNLIKMGVLMLANPLTAPVTGPTGGALIAEGFGLEALAGAMGAIKMAAGGIVHGSSIVNVGEYAGASHNPEVIAPLDKLKGMLGGGMGGAQMNELRVQSNEMVTFQQRTADADSFNLGYSR